MTTADGATGRRAPLLELRGVDAGYGTIDVLFGVDLALRPGQVHALLGPERRGEVDHAQGGERADHAHRRRGAARR